ncbi:MAG: hypothetical protein ABSE52_04580 [Candidatus Dormibacteria bacterium]
MTPGIGEFRQTMLDFVDGRIAVGEFDSVYVKMWEERRDHDWAVLDAEHPRAHHLIRENRAEWDRINAELTHKGELLPDDIQTALDHIYTDLDVLDQRPYGITVDQLREDCRQAITQLDELGHAAPSSDERTGDGGA